MIYFHDDDPLKSAAAHATDEIDKVVARIEEYATSAERHTEHVVGIKLPGNVFGGECGTRP